MPNDRQSRPAARNLVVSKKSGTDKPVSGKPVGRDRRVASPRRRSLRAPSPAALYERLSALYPDAHCELDFATPFQLAVATILSAQCTDKRVNMVTPVLFARYPTVESLARARQEDVEEIIKSTGFFRNKAKSIIAMAGALADSHGGEVPSVMDTLVTLPGIGRKTANVILGNAFNMNEGVVVDTHVGRLATRLGLTSETDPVKVEQGLMGLFPREQWTMLAHLLIFHGRRVCDAKKPRCAECTLAEICPSAGIGNRPPKAGKGNREPGTGNGRRR
ncbi:MAG: endonuclease [Geminicoccaceae bacterium]|nr:endonuclease [Geminicoccaceae bacterium]